MEFRILCNENTLTKMERRNKVPTPTYIGMDPVEVSIQWQWTMEPTHACLVPVLVHFATKRCENSSGLRDAPFIRLVGSCIESIRFLQNEEGIFW
jgi:hypothetical protein